MATKEISQEPVKRGRGSPRKNPVVVEVSAAPRQSVALDRDTMQAIHAYQKVVHKEKGIKLTIPQTICYAVFESLKR